MIINKEIEEMAEVIANMEKRNAHYYDEYMQEREAFADCNNIAEALYNAGYRKINKVAKEILQRLYNWKSAVIFDSDSITAAEKNFEDAIKVLAEEEYGVEIEE